MMAKAIYVAGKLNDDTIGYLLNIHKMLKVAEEARQAGFVPFIPALDLLMGICFGYTDYEQYFGLSQEWLKRSDGVLLVPGWETSKGTKREIITANEYGIPVFKNLKEMKNHFKKFINQTDE